MREGGRGSSSEKKLEEEGEEKRGKGGELFGRVVRIRE